MEPSIIAVILNFLKTLIFGVFKDPKGAWDNNAAKSRTFWVIMSCVTICSLLMYNVYGVLDKKVDIRNRKIDSLIFSLKNNRQSIYDMTFEKYAEEYIDSALKKSGDGTFICWVRIQKIEDKYFLYFKRAKGYYLAKSPVPFELSRFNRLYKDPNLVVDSCTYSFIEKEVDEKRVYLMTEEYAYDRRLDIVRDIFRKQNLPIRRFKFTVVKEDDGTVIWFFSFARLDGNIDSPEYDGYILELAANQKLQLKGFFVPNL